jgi:hypothetical protein
MFTFAIKPLHVTLQKKMGFACAMGVKMSDQVKVNVHDIWRRDWRLIIFIFVPFGLNVGWFSVPALLLVLTLILTASLPYISSETHSLSEMFAELLSPSESLKGWVLHCDAASLLLGLFAVVAGCLFSKIRRASFSETFSDTPSS